jgi:hypothetical protein
MTAERPAGVTAVAAAFLLAAVYLLVVGLTMLIRPEVIGMTVGSELLGEYRFSGPYVFLLVAAVGAAVTFGLWRLHRWARWAAIILAVMGLVMLVPSVSAAVVFFRMAKLALGALGVIVRTMIVWYLFQEPTVNAFAGHQKPVSFL